jgi:hypothetical protein
MDYAAQRRIRSSGIKLVRMLDLIPYDIMAVRKEIQEELDWRPYEGKHFESIFTRFYQGYILPRKFGIDKRRAHLSNLICCGAISREEALKELQQEIYPEELQAEDLAFVLKKLKLSQLEFDELMRTPPRRHLDFDNYRMFFRRYSYLAALRPVWETYRGWRLRTTG